MNSNERKREVFDVPNFEMMKAIGDSFGSFKTWKDSNGEEHRYKSTVYLDSWQSPCRDYDSVLCTQYVEDGIMYRCILCHANEMDIYCKGITQYGRRCKYTVADYSGDQEEWESMREDWRRRMSLESGTLPRSEYCHHHAKTAVQNGTRFSIDMLDEWLDGWQKETILRWKKSVLNNLQTLGALTLEDLRSRSKVEPGAYVYFIQCGKYVKIGTSRNPEARFKSLRSEKNTTIRPKNMDISDAKLIGYFPGGQELERHLHFLLRNEHAAGEWFSLGPSTSKMIQRYTDKGDFTVTGVIESLIADYDQILETADNTRGNQIDISNVYRADREIDIARGGRGY